MIKYNGPQYDVDDDDDDQYLCFHESIALSFQAGPKKAAQSVADLLMIMMMVVVVVVVVDNISIKICCQGSLTYLLIV